MNKIVARGFLMGLFLILGGGLLIGANLALKKYFFEIEFAEAPIIIRTSDGEIHWFEVEIAQSWPQHYRGLTEREAIPEGTGMLFVYDGFEPITKRVKGTVVPLDLVFASQEGMIIHVVEGAEPNSRQAFNSNGPAAYVLELPAGTLSSTGIKPGDLLIY